MFQSRQRSQVLRRGGAAAVLGVAAGWLGFSRFAVSHEVPLPPPLDAEPREVIGKAGRLAYYVSGDGAPLLLIHSINAAATAYEVRTVFERLRGSRRVYAVDLPGFGSSDRRQRDYCVGLYVQAVHDMLDVIEAEHGDRPVDALALSLGAEFLARAATEAPARFRSLALVNPTGFERARRHDDGQTRTTREIPGLRRLLQVPLWRQALFDLLVSRPSIRYFLERSWGSKAIDEGLAEFDYLAAHQPGAAHAPFAFVSGRLFSADIRQVYGRLKLPIWMPHGTRGEFSDFGGADFVRRRSNWTVEAFGTGAMPHIEQAAEFARRYERFLASQAEVGAVARFASATQQQASAA
jgi:pimeloyl-ACP methyl ester carboxylesterase